MKNRLLKTVNSIEPSDTLLAENKRLQGLIKKIKAHSQLSAEQYSLLFQNMPLGAREEDYSLVKIEVDKARAKGIESIQGYFRGNPELVRDLVSGIKIISVNRALLDMHQTVSEELYLDSEYDIDSWWDSSWIEYYAEEFASLSENKAYFSSQREDTQIDGTPFLTRTISFLIAGYEDTWERVITIHEDITDRKLLEEQLNKSHDELELKVQERTRELIDSEKRFRDFTNSTSDWFWEMNARLEYSYFSEGLNKFSGLNPEELIGKKRSDIKITGIEPEDLKDHFNTLQRHEPFRDFVYSVLIDNKKIWLSISGQPVFDDAGNFAGYRGTGRNVTKLKQLDQTLLDTIQQANAANHAKSQFLATMSHELRTPMTGVIGFADLLLEDELSSESLEKVHRIKSSANSLLCLLNDILDMSKIEAGKMEIENIDFNLIQLMTESISQVDQTRSSDKRLVLNIDCSPRFPENINSDPTRIRQVLINLVGNAIKFTKEGSVSVIGELLEDVKNQPVIKISVQDTGIGMSQETIKKLFTEFTQADASISRKYEGSGLGLAICQRLVHLLDGDIGVESSKGAGSLFWFTIPYKAATSVTLNETLLRSNIKLGAIRPLNILLAEDNRVNQLIIQKFIEGYGHKLTIVENGLDAVTTHDTNHFDLILMDIRMPEMDGLEATQTIRKMTNKKSDIPILAITADAMKENIKSYYEIGMNSFASKPINKLELALAINKAMGEEIHIVQSEAVQNSMSGLI